MKPKDVIAWTGAGTAVVLAICIAAYVIRAMMGPSTVLLLTPGVNLSLLVVIMAAFVSTLVVHISKVAPGKFEFSGMGVQFKGFACPSALWVVIFLSFSGAFLTLAKFLF